jgi:ribose transport system substrate-binding protein
MRKWPMLAFVVAVLLAGLAGGAAPPASAGSAAPAATPLQGKLIWYLDGASGNPAFLAAAQGIYQPLRAAGATLVHSFAQNASGQIDLGEMAKAFDRAIAAKPAAIVYFDFDNKALRPQVRRAREAGIPVFAFAGKPVSAVGVNAYLDFDNNGHGIYLGKTLAAAMPKGSEWTVIAALPSPNVETMLDGAGKSMQQAGMKFVGSRNSQRNLTDIASGGQKVMQALLQKFPNVKGIVAFNDDSALGALAAIKAAGKKPGKDIFVVSRNGAPDAVAKVRAGELLATCDTGIVVHGQLMGAAIRDHLTGRKALDKGAKIAPPDAAKCIVTKKNVSKYLPWDKQVKYVKIEER